MRRLLALPACLGAVALLSACVAEQSTIFQKWGQELNSTRGSITTDSRQRVVTVHDPGFESFRAGIIQPRRIVCAEPLPDVAVAVANSFGAGISVLAGKVNAAGSVSASAAEGLVHLAERTVAVQLLREQMYRACEAYSNGAISGTSYSLLLNRVYDTMVSMLLGEVAGGAFGRPLGALGGRSEAEASAMASLPAAIKNIDEGRKLLEGAQEDVAKRELELTEAKKDLADAQLKKKEDASVDVTAPAAKVDEKQTLRDAAVKKRDALIGDLKTSIQTAARSSAGFDKVFPAGAIAALPSEGVASELRKMQGQFLQRSSTSGYVAACIVELGLSIESKSGQKGTFTIDAELNKLALEDLQKASKRGRYESNNFTLFGVLQGIYRASGLYENCKENLKDALYLGHEDSKIARQFASGNYATKFAAAMAQCGSIRDPRTRLDCTRGVERINIAANAPDEPRAPLPGPGVALVGSGAVAVLPTVAFARAKSAVAPLYTAAEKLKALDMTKLRGTKETRERERTSLLARIEELSKQSSMALADARLAELRDLEKQLAEAQQAIAAPNDPKIVGENRRVLAQLNLQARTKSAELTVLANRADVLVRQANGLTGTILRESTK